MGLDGGARALEQLAAAGDARRAHTLKTPMQGERSCDFSFAGLKTSACRHVDEIRLRPSDSVGGDPVLDSRGCWCAAVTCIPSISKPHSLQPDQPHSLQPDRHGRRGSSLSDCSGQPHCRALSAVCDLRSAICDMRSHPNTHPTPPPPHPKCLHLYGSQSQPSSDCLGHLWWRSLQHAPAHVLTGTKNQALQRDFSPTPTSSPNPFFVFPAGHLQQKEATVGGTSPSLVYGQRHDDCMDRRRVSAL